MEDLIFQAKGFKKAAIGGTAFISRRPLQQSAYVQIETEQLTINENLEISANEFLLRPFDHITIRKKSLIILKRNLFKFLDKCIYPELILLNLLMKGFLMSSARRMASMNLPMLQELL